MKIKEIEAGKIKPNPFKKHINKGKLDQFRIDKMKESIDYGTLPLIFSVREKDGYELCFGHHRLEAIKQIKGNDFKLNCSILDYNDEMMLIDMIRENLTQRDTDFRDTEDSVVLARNWLVKKGQLVKEIHKLDDKYPQIQKGKKGFQPIESSYRKIAKFISKEGKIIGYRSVKNYLDVYDNIAPEIHEKIGKVVNLADKERKEKVSITQGIILSQFNDYEEQKGLLKAMQISPEQRTKEISKLITAYKEMPEQIKQKVREGKIDLIEIPEFKEGRLDINQEFEKTADSVTNDILQDLGSLQMHIREMNSMNWIDLSNDKKNRVITSICLTFGKTVREFILKLIEQGAVIDKRFVNLLKIFKEDNNGTKKTSI